MGANVYFVRYVIAMHKESIYRAMLGEQATLFRITVQFCPYPQIKAKVDTLLRYAATNSEVIFRVTNSLGSDIEIAPMFANAPINCILPRVWEPLLYAVEGRRFWQG